MSLLLLFRPSEGAAPPVTAVPYRTLVGVGLTLVLPLLFSPFVF